MVGSHLKAVLVLFGPLYGMSRARQEYFDAEEMF